MHYLRRFFKKINNTALNFRAFGGKTQLLGIFEKTLKILDEKFNRKIEFLTIFGKFVAISKN